MNMGWNFLKFLSDFGKTANDVATVAQTVNTVATGVQSVKEEAAKQPTNPNLDAKQQELNTVLNFLVSTQPDNDPQFDADVLAMVTKYKHKNLCDFAVAAQRAVTKRDAVAQPVTNTATTAPKA